MTQRKKAGQVKEGLGALRAEVDSFVLSFHKHRVELCIKCGIAESSGLSEP